ncbi:MAG TPA: triose-phosphate isomerase [Haliangiales bacterium]|nr:triose-phosphate isomerase [Haliangiales bacterium]
MARTPLVVGNWKLHLTISEALTLATEVKNQLFHARRVEVGIAPVFTALASVQKRIEGTALKLAAQDCHWEDKGAFTGEVSAPLLADVGVSYVIVGHSERRQHFGELDAAVGLKARAVLRAGISPIVCVGETEAQRDAGETFGRIAAQLEGALADIPQADAPRLVIAYEPVWAIGTGRTATPNQAAEVHAFIRDRLRERWRERAEDIRIQYGGSVKPDNAGELMAQPDVDGALVGGASLQAPSFVAIVRAMQDVL